MKYRDNLLFVSRCRELELFTTSHESRTGAQELEMVLKVTNKILFSYEHFCTWVRRYERMTLHAPLKKFLLVHIQPCVVCVCDMSDDVLDGHWTQLDCVQMMA